MIKKIIFDLDNTLIDWQDSYYNFAIENACKDLKLISRNNKILKLVINTMDNYEKKYDYFSIENIVKDLNSNKEITFTNEFVEKVLYYFSLCVPDNLDSKIIETLDYLNSKYELVVLTNWFENYQIKRLEKSGISHYFTHVYGTDKIKNKPNRKAFETAAGNCNLNECVMVGDNLNTDVIGALNCGMKAIYYNRKKNIVDSSIVCINKFEDLVDLL